MNIDEMSDSEKSVLLARAMGMRIVFNPTQIVETAQHQELDGLDYVGLDFYSTANMALAWRVLNWAIGLSTPVWYPLSHWWTRLDSIDDDGWKMLDLSPADAQRAWLDKVLSLAIDADLVPEPAEEAI